MRQRRHLRAVFNAIRAINAIKAMRMQTLNATYSHRHQRQLSLIVTSVNDAIFAINATMIPT